MSETVTAQEQVKDTIEEWAELLGDQEGATAIAKKLREYSPEQIIEPKKFQQLKNLASDQKIESYLETLKQELEKELGASKEEFNISKYEDLTKTEQAKEIADYFVHTLNIRPVKLGREEKEVEFYRYDPSTGLWKFYSQLNLQTKTKELAGDEFTIHLRREVLNQMKHHPFQLRIRDMGTAAEWLVINDAKKIYLEDLSDLKNMRVEDVDSDDQALHKVNVDYNPEADCPQFKEFIEFMLDGKENQIKTLQEFLGWTLAFPDRTFKKALLILGVSNSGKSQLAEIWEELFSNNSGKSVTNLSLRQMGQSRTFHLPKLENSILNIQKELSAEKIYDPSRIKVLTAQESLMVEPKGEGAFTIEPKAKHLCCANVKPEVDKQDSAFFGRFLTLKAPNPVPKEDQIKDLGQKLFEEEAEGIFIWALRGLKRLNNQGDFTLNPTSAETKRMWWEFGKSTHRFLWQECEVTGKVNEDYIPKDRLYELYELWYEKNKVNMDKMSSQKFKYEVAEQPGISEERKRINGQRTQCFTGIKADVDSITGGFEEQTDDRDQESI